jgi:hypothetical protein
MITQRQKDDRRACAAGFIIILAILSLFLTRTARADVEQFTINSAPFFDGHEFVGPYNSSLTGGDAFYLPLHSFCIELNNTVNFGQAFAVTPILLSDYQPGTPAQMTLLEVGYLMVAAELASYQPNPDVGMLSLMNRAIWYLTTPGAAENPYLNTADVGYWVNWAQNHPVEPTDTQGFIIYLRDGDIGQSQMGFVMGPFIPEPGTWATVVFAFCLFAGLKLWQLRRHE